MKIISKNERWRGKGKNQRTECPRCKIQYMQGAYVYISSQDQQKKKQGKWEKIGNYCMGCGHFLPSLGQDRITVREVV